ncbi:MAG: cobalamin-dependent protein [Thermoleophilia bacterium]
MRTAKETGAHLVGSSALMTTTMAGQQKLEHALAEAGLRGRVKTMVEGAAATQGWADKIGADVYAERATEAVPHLHRCWRRAAAPPAPTPPAACGGSGRAAGASAPGRSRARGS